MLIVGRSGGSQNRLDPHSAQNLRRAPASLFGLSIHLRPACSTSTRSSQLAAVEAETWPCHRRHSSQWQISTSRNGPLTSYLTAPHRHRPVAIVPPSGVAIIRSWHTTKISPTASARG